MLHIDLQEGFSNDAVIVSVNAREVYSNAQVKTRLQVGHADDCTVQISEPIADVTIALPGRNVKDSLQLPIRGTTYLGISVEKSGAVTFRVSGEPFGYL